MMEPPLFRAVIQTADFGGTGLKFLNIGGVPDHEY